MMSMTQLPCYCTSLRHKLCKQPYHPHLHTCQQDRVLLLRLFLQDNTFQLYMMLFENYLWSDPTLYMNTRNSKIQEHIHMDLYNAYLHIHSIQYPRN